ncbi:MAG: hypothetical protein Tsb0020_25730 [Haliangiales bacterium]
MPDRRDAAAAARADGMSADDSAHAAVGAATRFVLGDFEFEPASGGLRDLRTDASASAGRLAPLPAALLTLLIDKQGQIASRDEIQRQLWPDTHVEVEQSLHHCVRQIRAALGDRASAPRYIETIPRRGYRLKCAVEAVPAPGGELAPAVGERADAVADADVRTDAGSQHIAAGGAAPTTTSVDEHGSGKPQRRWPAVVMVAAMVALLGLVALWGAFRPGGQSHEPVRVAIMPFDDPAMSADTAARLSRVGERLLADLTVALAGVDERAAVLGPRTTQPLRAQGRTLAEIARETDTSYVINAKYIAADGRAEVLIELIRTRDGKHVWVQYYSELGDWRAVVDEIVAGVVATIPSASP